MSTKRVPEWLESLGPEAVEIVDLATALREAREGARRAIEIGDPKQMQAALLRLQEATRRARSR